MWTTFFKTNFVFLLQLKACCLEFILDNPDLLQTETYQELGESLQAELRDLGTWGRSAAQSSLGPTPDYFTELHDMAARMRIRTEVIKNLKKTTTRKAS